MHSCLLYIVQGKVVRFDDCDVWSRDIISPTQPGHCSLADFLHLPPPPDFLHAGQPTNVFISISHNSLFPYFWTSGQNCVCECLVRGWHSPPSSRHILYPAHPALRWETPFSSLWESRLLSVHRQYETPAPQGDDTSGCCWPVQAYEGGETQEASGP